MYYNINITGSSYTQSTGIIHVSVFNGVPPYQINYRNFDGSNFTGILVDDGLYFGYPQYSKSINVPIGVYFIDVTDNYGLSETLTECVIVGYSGNPQSNIDNTPEDDITIIFPCSNDNTENVLPNFYWLQTEDGCYIDLGFNKCLNSCFLIGNR